MRYATRTDIDAIYGPDFLTGMLDEGVDPDEAVGHALDMASTEIDTHLSARYRLPLANAPAALKLPTINIAIYTLANRHTFLTQTIRERYEDAIALLKRIADGKAGLGMDEPVIETGEGASDGGAAYFGHERLFERGRF